MMHEFRDLFEGRHLDESGFTTAELMANAAMGIIALAAIWAALNAIGLDLIAMMREKIFQGR